MSLYRIWATNVCVMTPKIKLRNKSAYGCNFSCRWLSLLCWPTRTDTPAWCPATSSMILTRVHLMSMATFCLQLSTATELVVMVGCVSIAGDRSSTWWSLGTLWQVFNITAILVIFHQCWYFTGTIRCVNIARWASRMWWKLVKAVTICWNFFNNVKFSAYSVMYEETSRRIWKIISSGNFQEWQKRVRMCARLFVCVCSPEC